MKSRKNHTLNRKGHRLSDCGVWINGCSEYLDDYSPLIKDHFYIKYGSEEKRRYKGQLPDEFLRGWEEAESLGDGLE